MHVSVKQVKACLAIRYELIFGLSLEAQNSVGILECGLDLEQD